MVASSKAIRIGVIAEETNDVDVMYELTCKIIRENKFSLSHFVGHGCGKLRRKCKAWSEILLAKGCDHLAVVHDLDQYEEATLRKELDEYVLSIGFGQTVILIPVEEIEAWLLSDPKAVKTVFNMRRLPKIPKAPEKIKSPKEYLGRLVRNESRSQYLNTVHNRRIARELSIGALDRCPSFSSYPAFLTAAFPKRSMI